MSSFLLNHLDFHHLYYLASLIFLSGNYILSYFEIEVAENMKNQVQSCLVKQKKVNETAGLKYMFDKQVLIIMIPFLTNKIVQCFYGPYFPELLNKYYNFNPKKSFIFNSLTNISYLVCSWFMLKIIEKYEDKPLNYFLILLNAIQAFLIFPITNFVR